MNNNSVVQINQFGIVSPCSTCSNKRAVPDTVNGLPACPRLEAQAAKSEYTAIGLSTIQFDPLALTGNEDADPPTNSTSLVNPVYSTALNSILVWVATVKDNATIYDSDGNLVNPDLLDPDFDTNYIRCKEKPITPADHESVYRQKGAWNENDQLNITFSGTQQTIPGTDSSTLVLLNGFANKVNFAYSSPRIPADRDYGVSGT